MERLARWLLTATALWAAFALAGQVAVALWRRPALHATPRGSGTRGILYGFTGAMLPARKESVARHPLSFALGLLLHTGVGGALLLVLASAVRPALSSGLRLALGVLAGAGLAAGIALLARRAARPDLRALSVPDDFAASLLVMAFLAASLAYATGPLPRLGLFLASALLLLYLPLGKLRHAVFFWVARADLARRLGIRGVWPPEARTPTAPPHDDVSS